MQFAEGISLELADGTWIRVDVSVTNEDLRALAAEWGAHPSQLAQVPMQGQAIAMRAFVRMLIAQRSIEARTADGTTWVEAVGKPMLAKEEQMLGQVKQYVQSLPVKENDDDVWSTGS